MINRDADGERNDPRMGATWQRIQENDAERSLVLDRLVVTKRSAVEQVCTPKRLCGCGKVLFRHNVSGTCTGCQKAAKAVACASVNNRPFPASENPDYPGGST